MPRGTKRAKTDGNPSKSESRKKNDGNEAIANVNNSHAKVFSHEKTTKTGNISPVKAKKIKSKVVPVNTADTRQVKRKNLSNRTSTEKVQFEEDGEIVHMEIDDGGAAAAEFSSEYESEGNNSFQNTEDSSESEHSYNEETDAESGEINNSDTETECQQNFDCSRDNLESPKSKKIKKKSSRPSVEDQLSSMNNTLSAMRELLKKKDITEFTNSSDSKNDRGKKQINEAENQAIQTNSKTTVYRNVLEKINDSDINDDPEITFKKRDCSSSEEGKIDTSDEMMEIDCNQFIAECAAEANRRKRTLTEDKELDPKEIADNMIREAEAAKIRMLPTPGNCFNLANLNGHYNGITANQHSSIVDENYVAIGSHIDKVLRDKIHRGEYVDFACLLPRDRLSSADEGRLELVHKGGQTYFIPAEKEGYNTILSFYKWELAFRAFSNI